MHESRLMALKGGVMNYGRFKKIIVSLALMCVFALPVATTFTPSAYAQSGVYSDVAQWRRYGYRGYPGYGYRGYGYRGYYGYPSYGGYYRRGYYNPYYRPYYRGYYGYPYGGYYRRHHGGGFRFGFRF
jgi:hypothetical protein